jgi:hypothetical protein
MQRYECAGFSVNFHQIMPAAHRMAKKIAAGIMLLYEGINVRCDDIGMSPFGLARGRRDCRSRRRSGVTIIAGNSTRGRAVRCDGGHGMDEWGKPAGRRGAAVVTAAGA